MDRDYNLNRFERFLVLANEGGIKPIIVLNKTDLISENELDARIIQIQNRFKEIEIITTCTVTDHGLGNLSLTCKFANCTHTNEPGCAVLNALKQNTLNKDKYDNYIKLRKESEFYKMNEVVKREKDRKFGKLIKRYLDMHKDG
jgi:putative ribosome biogenesis GTPase RsgA